MAEPNFCAICQNTIGEVPPCNIPCQHRFHPECLKPWQEKTNSCPVCRQPIDPKAPTRQLPSDTSDDVNIARELVQQVILLQMGNNVVLAIVSDETESDSEDDYKDPEDLGQCASCLRIDNRSTFQWCQRCHSALYCGVVCQRSHWNVHRLECEDRVPCANCRTYGSRATIPICICGSHRFCSPQCAHAHPHICFRNPHKRRRESA